MATGFFDFLSALNETHRPAYHGLRRERRQSFGRTGAWRNTLHIQLDEGYRHSWMHTPYRVGLHGSQRERGLSSAWAYPTRQGLQYLQGSMGRLAAMSACCYVVIVVASHIHKYKL
ncbi:hypothetical protein TEQG_02037 [Trichophyton equinum CBS 127.97]|uniref:Uncharacterized protein n=1 Tax=Trichophyton equinum (strain ATCC MYA-4606 / CBS 127.97) TaxID=559882 RepID=F2PMA3_TRIEC|nr:hypothetical protein TEQG_02037 [Trichophyton equinum CBS 127.97]